jgi:hypothetical protein
MWYNVTVPDPVWNKPHLPQIRGSMPIPGAGMDKINYYRMWFDDSEPLAMTCRKADLGTVSEHFVYQSRPVKEWPARVTFYAEGQNAEDYLFPTMVNWILVSRRVKQVLDQCPLDGVQLLPVKVVTVADGVEMSGYHVLHVWKQISALDSNRTTFSTSRHDDYPQLNIVRAVLRRTAIGGANIFRLRNGIRQYTFPNC